MGRGGAGRREGGRGGQRNMFSISSWKGTLFCPPPNLPSKQTAGIHQHKKPSEQTRNYSEIIRTGFGKDSKRKRAYQLTHEQEEERKERRREKNRTRNEKKKKTPSKTRTKKHFFFSYHVVEIGRPHRFAGSRVFLGPLKTVAGRQELQRLPVIIAEVFQVRLVALLGVTLIFVF